MRLLAALAVAGLFASCGGENPETPSEPPAQLLSEAFANSSVSGEAVAEVELSLEGQPLLSEPITAELEGPYESASVTGDPAGGPPSFDLAFDGSIAGFGAEGELISTGTDAFVVLFGENYRVGPERVAQAGEMLAAEGGGFGLDPSSWFAAPRYAGAEEVDGADAERVEARLDSEAMAADVGATASALGAPRLLSEIASGAGAGEIEAWVSYGDHTLRRLRVEFPFGLPARARRAAGGATGGAAKIEVEISEIGAEFEIAPPEGGGYQPIDQLISRLRDLVSLAL